ncbi:MULTISPECIES: RusA family crossover junction endodeoxyribonuclease [Bacillus subtilis group]|uniref:RusA family crossover junction endodeoxyribonuclease n=1 Tax=Bacillus subtilis group TaxID=653685 RepID=UPI0021B41EAB|nr:RusA family crossover junction endodeoxyribonuclease [Bacillus velezensis]
MSRFIISYDDLPISVNQYIKPSARFNPKTGRTQIHMYETRESKDFKKRFQAYLKREVIKQKWDVDQTKNGHWYLDCIFYQSRTNQDNNNYYKILCDALTGIVIDDDKNILVRTQRVMYDSKNPRFVAVLRPVEYTGIFKDNGQYTEFLEYNCLNCKKDKEKCPILRKAKEGRIQQEIHIDNGLLICEKRKT